MKEQEKVNSVPICAYGATAINVVMEHSPLFSERETHTHCEISYLTPFCFANKEIAFLHE